MGSYASIKQGLMEIVEELSELNVAGGAQRLDEVSRKLDTDRFNLVILGQFKRGKSTLINALLGTEVLPTAIVPLTSVVTVLRYGEEGRAVVRFLNGTRQDIGLTEIPKYVTERENPENRLGVGEVEVFYPSDYLKEGVRIVDTPGVGSVFQHNTDVAYAYLPHADAGIFVVTPDPPLGEAEHRFLKDIREHLDKLFFVLNKIDLVNETDLEEAMAFTTGLIQKDLGQAVPIYPVSAALALAGKQNSDNGNLERSNLLPFETELQRFLVQEKGKVFLNSVISGLFKTVSDETMACRLEQEAARLSVSELKEKVSVFEGYAVDTEKDRDQQGFILDGRVKKLHQRIDQDLETIKKDKLPSMLNSLETVFADEIVKRRSAHDLEKKLEGIVFEGIKTVFTEFRKAEAENIATELENIYIDIAGRTNRIIEGIVKMTADLFKVELKPFTTVEQLSKKSDFYFLLKDDPGAIELIRLSVTHALPAVMAKGRILKRLKGTVSERFERHCGRVRYDLIRRIDETTRRFKKTLNEKIDLTLLTIREALHRAVALKEQSEEEMTNTLTALSSRMSRISGIRKRLGALSEKTSRL